MKLAFTATFNHPVEVVWPFLAEPDRWVEWIPALIERTRIDNDPIGPGTRWKAADRVGPFVVEFTDELIALEPNQRVAFKQSSPWNSWGEYRLESQGGKTVVHVLFEGEMSGKIRWMNLMPDSWATTVFRKDLERLGKFLDSNVST